MNASIDSRATTTRSYQELITQRARELWQIRGCPEGLDQSIWFDAEIDLVRRRLIPRSAISNGTDAVSDRTDSAKLAVA